MIMEFYRTAHKEWRTARSGGVKVIKTDVCACIHWFAPKRSHSREHRVFPEVWAHGDRRLGGHEVDAQYLCKGGES